MRCAPLLLAFAFTVGSVWADDAPGSSGAPNPGVPELKVLHRMAGKWEARLPNSEESIRSTRTWILDGRFLRHEFNLASGLAGVIYRGYDQRNNRYVMTFLDSTGNASFLTGYWSEDQKMLTFEAQDISYFVQKYESYFPDGKTEQWTISFRGTDGAGEISATAVKQE